MTVPPPNVIIPSAKKASFTSERAMAREDKYAATKNSVRMKKKVSTTASPSGRRRKRDRNCGSALAAESNSSRQSLQTPLQSRSHFYAFKGIKRPAIGSCTSPHTGFNERGH